jgi:ABC-2 type transport system ATP-binding protein
MQQLRLDGVAARPDGAITARLATVAVEDVASALVQAGVRLRRLTVDRPDLEELFVSITGEGFDVLR